MLSMVQGINMGALKVNPQKLWWKDKKTRGSTSFTPTITNHTCQRRENEKTKTSPRTALLNFGLKQLQWKKSKK